MALAAGTRLGSYVILAPLGAGGMGEVYRARDEKLGREVAIKILPDEVVTDAERLARFDREARLLASLNHPNVAAIHGFEEADGRRFLALELVEGEDLKERLDRGPIPLDEALEIAAQIAAALEEAHSRGIVHRDLKPANVKLTPEGRVKVLDFGLAKMCEVQPGGRPSAEELSRSPTLARSSTRAGAILGTAAYMSPEQATGKAVDKRSDIWSFGVVLFEMLSGRRLFAGESSSEVLAAVLKEGPEWGRLPPDCPPGVRRLLRRCLQKDPRERLHDVGDARLEVSDVRAGTSDAPDLPPSSAPGPRRVRPREWVAWAVAIAAVGGAGLARMHIGPTPTARAAVRFHVDMPLDRPLDHIDQPVVSPDGRYLAYVARDNQNSPHIIWLTRLADGTARPVAGTEGVTILTWSSDSRSVAFLSGFESAEPTLKAIAIESSSPRTVCAVPYPRFAGLSWGEQGVIVFSAGSTGGTPRPGDEEVAFRLYAVDAEGGKARPLTSVDASRGETGHFFPQILPGGRLLYGVASDRPENDGVYVASLAAPDDRRRIDVPISGRANFSWVPSGDLFYPRERSVLAQAVDLERLRMSGPAVVLAEDVLPFWPALDPAVLAFAATGDGTLAFTTSRSPIYELVWFNRQGTRLGAVGKPGPYGQFSLSPEDSRVVVERGGDIWVSDAVRGVAIRVTSDPLNEFSPAWSADGQELFYTQVGEGWSVRRQRPGRDEAVVVLEDSGGANFFWPHSASADGRTLVGVDARGFSGRPGYRSGVAVLDVSGGGETAPRLLLPTDSMKAQPVLSDDDRWLAYTSDETGEWEVYIVPFRQTGEKVRVSPDGGRQPRWRGDGRELFYVTAEGQLMAVDVRERGGRFEVGSPVNLFAAGVSQPHRKHYDVTADGQRFLVLTSFAPGISSIEVVLNSTALLE